MACNTDPVLVAVTEATASLLRWFGAGQCPAEVGVTANVRYFAGDAAPLAAWDSHSANGESCAEPFVWVRTARRFFSHTFPAPAISTDCTLPRVAALELGVGWCAVVDQQPRDQDYAQEASISSDTAWRLESALCETAARLRGADDQRLTGIDALAPYGPEGGVIAWTGLLFVTY